MSIACEAVPLARALVLSEPQQPALYAYFPDTGCIALLARTAGSPDCEAGMVGAEGMVGAHLALGTFDSPVRAIVQSPGVCLRMRAAMFRREVRDCPALQRVVHRYLYLTLARQAAGAACVHFHLIAPRLARWLLMSQDRVASCRFRVTHEWLADMLGVRRVSITNAAGALQRDGLIRYHRGEFEIIERAGLQAAACSCYAAERSAYTRLLG